MSNEDNSGEIDFIDADRLEDHQGDAVANSLDSINFTRTDFGDEHDSRAIRNIMLKLGETPAGKKSSSEQLREAAATVYARNCQMISSGKATDAQIENIADIFGESVQSLRERLIEPEIDSAPQGENALLKSLFSKPE